MPADYRGDAQGLTLAGSVFVEAEWDRRYPLDETRWVQGVARQTGLPSVMVCHVRCTNPTPPK
jgi:predicted TIM-barrel fold metal-dependent hydrolase